MANEKCILYKDDKPWVALKRPGYVRPENHKYIIYDKTPPTNFISIAAKLLTKAYFDNVKLQTIKQWKRDRNKYRIQWEHSKDKVIVLSSGLNYHIIANELREHGKFENEKFNLPPLGTMWLDISLDMSQNFHFVDPGSSEALMINDGITKQQYGKNYPINPKLDREGHIFTTFQPALLRRIIRQRKSLIENSDKSLFSDWIMDLRSLINDSVSIVDICLNQLYNKAKFAPEADWTFDLKKLGKKNNRRLKDKLKWVRQITGQPFDIENEMVHFDTLRKLRNHLNHFDPPTLVVTLEEATNWLNDVLYGNL